MHYIGAGYLVGTLGQLYGQHLAVRWLMSSKQLLDNSERFAAKSVSVCTSWAKGVYSAHLLIIPSERDFLDDNKE